MSILIEDLNWKLMTVIIVIKFSMIMITVNTIIHPLTPAIIIFPLKVLCGFANVIVAATTAVIFFFFFLPFDFFSFYHIN